MLHKILDKSVFLFLFCITLCVQISAYAQPNSDADSKTLIIAADEWCPINCAIRDPMQGVGVDLAKEIFSESGYKIRYVVMPWARALNDVREGRIDAIIGANKSDDPTLVYPQTPIFRVTDDFYVLADSPVTFSNLDSLKDYKIGVIKDYGYDPQIKAFIAAQSDIPGKIQVVAGDTALDQNIQKLLAKRIDVLVESSIIMDYKLQKTGLSKKIKHIGSVEQGNVYLGFSPALSHSPQLAEIFDKGMKNLSASGKFKTYYSAYGLTHDE